MQVSSKIGVIETLIEKVDKIILGGGMIFTFYKARGLSVGSSLVEVCRAWGLAGGPSVRGPNACGAQDRAVQHLLGSCQPAWLTARPGASPSAAPWLRCAPSTSTAQPRATQHLLASCQPAWHKVWAATLYGSLDMQEHLALEGSRAIS